MTDMGIIYGLALFTLFAALAYGLWQVARNRRAKQTKEGSALSDLGSAERQSESAGSVNARPHGRDRGSRASH